MSPLNECAIRGTWYFLCDEWRHIGGTKCLFSCATSYEKWHIFSKNPYGARRLMFVPHGAMSGTADFSKECELDFVNYIDNLLFLMNVCMRHSPVRRVCSFLGTR